MTRTDVAVVTDDGRCVASLHTPGGGGRYPGVIVYPDAGGARETFRTMGDHLAELGFVALVPDVYYRNEGYEPFAIATVFSDPTERRRLMTLAGTLTPAMAVRDAHSFVDALTARPEVHAAPVGTVGYCMGGRTSLIVAGHLGDRIGAAASFHGGGLGVDGDPDSPHHRAPFVRAEVYVGAASDDDSFDAVQEDTLRRAFDSAGVHYRIETYPALHGFAVADNPTYDEAAAGAHWQALVEFFTTSLEHQDRRDS